MRNEVVKISRFIVFLFAIATILFTGIGQVSAQQAGLSISPAVIEEVFAPGATENYSLRVENLNNYEETFYLFTRNIKDVGQNGTPIFAGDFERTGYELADWIQLPYNEITIPANTEIRVPITITVPEDAAPCGHFGGIFFSVEPPSISGSGAAVGYQVANIVTIRVQGECREQATIRQFSTDRFLYGSQDVKFTTRIENSGNVLIRPYGPLEIYNSLGKKVGTLTFNESRRAIFPGNTETFPELRWQGEGIGFGRYEAIISPVYGEQGGIKTMSTTVTFWVLPMNIIGPALIGLAVVLLITFVAVKIYIRRALAHMQGGRRLNPRRRRRGGSPTMLIITTMLVVTALFMLVLLLLFA